MSERCSHCHKLMRSACSSYSGRIKVQALQVCGNLSEVDRYREAAGCEGAANSDRALAICMALKALCEPHGDEIFIQKPGRSNVIHGS